MVYVYDKNNKSYEPCSNAMARTLLKKNYAEVIKHKPFSIKLNFLMDEKYEKLLELLEEINKTPTEEGASS